MRRTRSETCYMGAYACGCSQLDTFSSPAIRCPRCKREAERGLAFAEKARFGLVIDVITTQLALIRMLRGMTPKFGCFDDGQFNELRDRTPFVQQTRPWRSPRVGTGSGNCRRAILAGDYAAAMDAASKAQRLLLDSLSES